MLIAYARSSSLSQLDYCEQSYFMTYNLGLQQDPNNKTVAGTATHKVLEILGGLKKFAQDNPDSERLTIVDDALGEISVDKSELYKVSTLSVRDVSKINLSRASKEIYRYDVQVPDNHTRVGLEFVNYITDMSAKYYESRCVERWQPALFRDVNNFVWIPLEFHDNEYNPLFRKIVQPEQSFNIPIEQDWAKFRYSINGEIIEGNFAVKGTIDLITEIEPGVLETVDWKGLPLDTPIPTLFGWSTMGELAVGDILFDESGKQTKVLAKSKVNKKKCYKITFDDKTTVVCDIDHLWKLNDGSVVNVLKLKVKDKIAVAKPIDTPHLVLPIDPYILGMWLGDGRNRGGEISSADEFVFEEIKRRGYDIGEDISCNDNSCLSKTVYGLTTQLKKLNLINNKHIPDMYLRASFEQRLDLLRGLMDSDGNVNTCRKQAVFTNCNKQLSDDVKELLLTLGQRPNQGNVISHGFGLVTQVYPIHFKPLNINPFLLPRKAEKVDQAWGVGLSYRRAVRSIEETEEQLTQCIMVDSPTSTFLCTENMIPTHNTGKRYNWGKGTVKDYAALKKDPQLQLYFYALSKLYGHEYPDISFTIYFIRDGGPFAIDFDSSHISGMEDILKSHFEYVKSNYRPKMLDINQKDFRCNKLCHFYKNNWEGTNKNMCRFIHDKIDEIGLKKTIELYQSPEFKLDKYSSPGA